MRTEEFEQYRDEQMLVIADKVKEIEIAIRTHRDLTAINESLLVFTKVKDRATEILAEYVRIQTAEMEINDEEQSSSFSYNPYEDENDNNTGYGSCDASDYGI